MASTERSTALSDAEQRIITIKTEAGDIVKFSGNPAELPGARFETRKALRRAGAFKLLIMPAKCGRALADRRRGTEAEGCH